MIKRLFTYMIAALALAACSDDEKYAVEPVDDDGTITFTISIPEQEKVVSRAEKEDTSDERKINDLSVLIYDNSGNLLQSEIGVADFTDPSGENSLTRITVTLSDEAKAFSGDATIYIIANAGHLLTNNNTATIAALKAVTTDATLPSEKGFLMSGNVKSSLNSASLLTNKIILYRTEAKLTIENDATTFRLESAKLYNAATKGYVTAGIPEADNTYATDYSANPVNFDNPTTDFLLYTYPRRNDNPENPFIIVGGKYAGNDAYYRLDLYKEDKALDINPNYWYEIHISSVTGPGYPSAEEAAKHPSANMSVTIHDHAPEVFDIAFDDTHELGVTDVITYSANEGGKAILTVKYYTKNTAEMDTPPVLTCDEDWLSIGEPDILVTGDGTETHGKIAQYPVTFKATDQLGSLDALIKTTWQGLSRTTQVNWTRVFDDNAISTAVLTIHPTDGSGDKVITDYWTFLSGKGDAPGDAGKAPRLYGIQPEKMGGKVRSEGFHFPVMYGERGKTDEARWSYSYKVTMTNIENAKYDCSCQITGDAAVKGSVVFTEIKNETHYTFTLTRPGNTSKNDGSDPKNGNDYTYGTGKLILTVKPKGSKETVRVASRYEFDLYHTGFFHYDTGNHRTGNHDNGYYYYEVLPVDGATARTRYILDRNLGAKAAGMYIQTLEGTSHVPANEGWPFSCGNESAGGYYKVAYDEGTTSYNDPVMFDDDATKSNVCPPGYRVPKQRMWDAIRNSKKFISRQSTAGATSYFTSYYETEVTDNGSPVTERIYFPKSRFLDGSSQSGDANSGYYWTQTAAVGTEKDEIGRWLKSLQLSGAATSYINGQVENYSMSVRCINSVDDPETYNVTSFNVKGATHVFLYKGEVSDKEYTTSWPGHAIGNYSTVDNFFNFVYESTVYKPEDLKVIFNYVDDKGVIKTISKNGNVELSKAKGWKVKDLVDKNVECDRNNPSEIEYDGALH